ncbi:MAG TPA: carbohydrate-binding protein, partial [Chthoniobacteraceae bacterium]|nr:carbohydrate-binding protein [Chthoniobacteraceae bacterium]
GDKTTEPSATAATLVKSEAEYSTWNADMLHAGDILEASGIPSDVAASGTFAGGQVNLLGYYSWGSNDDQFNSDAYESLEFAPGAIGDTAVSTSARTFLPATGGQTLITDLIAQGITGVRGYVNEPLLNAISSPTIDLSFYLSGYTLAESFYAGSKYVGWEDINIGDPLCAPYFGANVSLTTPTQASAYNNSSGGVQTESCAESALDVGYINSGDYTVYHHVPLNGVSSFIARVASGGPGGDIQITLDSPSGTVIGTCPVPATGDWQTWTTETCGISGASGTHNLYLVFSGASGFLFNFQWFALKQTAIPRQLTPGATVSLQAMDNGAYVSTGTNGAPTLAADSATAGSTEKYLVVDAGNGNIALQSVANGEYVSVDNGSSSPLSADQTSIGPDTTFTEIDVGGNNVALLSMANGLYPSADLGQDDQVWAESISVSPAETFNITLY